MSDFSTKLPIDMWRLIERYLTSDELNVLQQTCHFFNHHVPYTGAFLQPLYNRIRALVPPFNNLPVVLPQSNAQATLLLHRLEVYLFGEYVSKLSEEIAYLKTHHPAYFTDERNAILDQKDLKIETLEQKNAVLDAINSHIVEKEIIRIHESNLKKTTLNISNKNITRLPQSLILNQKYQIFWNNLKKLHCGSNKALRVLNVQALVNLKDLHCTGSGLEFLGIRGLNNLVDLACGDNQLSSLDFRGIDNLISLKCTNNQLKFLNIENLHNLKLLSCAINPLTHLDLRGNYNLKVVVIFDCPLQDLNLEGISLEGLTLRTRNELRKTEERLLFNQLLTCGMSDVQKKENLIRRLGDRYNYGNCENHLGTMAALSFFACDTIASAKSHFLSFAIFSSKKVEKENTDKTSLKRNREEELDKDDEPKKKKDKKNP